ncbi:AAA family ATPase (plasmid) [Haloferax sp. S1W]|uniref:AAA family ATPase n=1 Tax=Haloferax sp. S1W TaxID=3377110 RepID=UPI0037C82FF8
MDIDELHRQSTRVLDEISRAVVVDRAVLRRILTGVLSQGHVLLEDVPGTGKTLTAQSFATALGLSFSRIQFTPDLLPADVTGTYIYDERDRTFEFSEGPLFSNVVLADEINRASPKTQAALLEAMAEGQVTVDGETHILPDPFFVIATQNPVEQGEGTFPLPEAQKDRFLIKDSLGYPDEEGELTLLDRRDERDKPTPSVSSVLSADLVHQMQRVPERVRVDDEIKQYIVDIVRRTRTDSRVSVGVSPRGCQRLFEVVRATAAVQGRQFVIPDDVKAVAHATLAHRIVPTAEATVNNVDREQLVDEVLAEVSVPTVNRGVRA